MTVTAQDAASLVRDARCQTGAYITFDGKLYEVVEARLEKQAGRAGLGGFRTTLALRVVDATSSLEMDQPPYRHLNEDQVADSRLVREAPIMPDHCDINQEDQ